MSAVIPCHGVALSTWGEMMAELIKRRVKAKTHMEDPILSLSEAARMMGKSSGTVGRWIHDGLLECIRMPSGLRGVRRSEVNKFLGVVYFARIDGEK